MQVVKIRSRSNEKLAQLLKNRENFFFLEGKKLVEEALQLAPADILICSAEREADCFQYQERVGQLWIASEGVLDKITMLKTAPPVIAVYKNLKPQFELENQKAVIGLFEIQDPGNMGTIFRSALAFNIRDIVLLGNCVRMNNSKFIRAAQTALFKIRWQVFLNYEQFLKRAERKHFNIYLADSQRGKKIISPEEIKFPALILFGSEGQGLPAELFLDYPTLKIPQSDAIDSLNVAVAASIIFYEIHRRIDL